MTPSAAGRPLALAALLVIGGALAAQAEPPTGASLPRLLGIEITVLDRAHGEDDITASVARRVLNHVTPQLEELGYVVERVGDAKQAARHGTHALGLHLRLDSRRVWVAADADEGIEIWGRWTLWSADQREKVAKGWLGRVGSRAQEAGLGRPVVDDEEAVARNFVDSAMSVLGPWVEYVQNTPPEYRAE